MVGLNLQLSESGSWNPGDRFDVIKVGTGFDADYGTHGILGIEQRRLYTAMATRESTTRVKNWLYVRQVYSSDIA